MKRRFFLRFMALSAVSLVLVCCSCVPTVDRGKPVAGEIKGSTGKPDKGHVSGRITSGTGEPLEGCVVYFHNRQTNRLYAEDDFERLTTCCRTDAEGRYLSPPLDAATYTIFASWKIPGAGHSAMGGLEQGVEILAGETVQNVNFQLTRSEALIESQEDAKAHPNMFEAWIALMRKSLAEEELEEGLTPAKPIEPAKPPPARPKEGIGTPGKGRVSGRITSEAGEPLARCVLYFYNRDTKRFYAEDDPELLKICCRTDARGHYVSPPLEPGAYTVLGAQEFVRRGLEGGVEEVKVRGGWIVKNVDFRLIRALKYRWTPRFNDPGFKINPPPDPEHPNVLEAWTLLEERAIPAGWWIPPF